MTSPSAIHAAPPPSAQPGQPAREDEQSIVFLEQEQLVSDRSIAVPPAQLSTRARAALWLLRIFALIVTSMVIYTFVSQLR
jgi:hypothetical protein